MNSIPPCNDLRARTRSPAVLCLSLVLAAGTSLPLWAGIPEPDLVWYGRVLTASEGSTVRLTTGTLVWQITPPAGGTPWQITTTLTNINDQFSYVLRVPCESPEPGVPASPNTAVLTSPALTYNRVTVTLDGQALTFTQPVTFAPTLAHRGTVEQIDLILGSLPLDSDADGMTDDWETLHFGSATGASAEEDSDGDGMNNVGEFRAGTHPKDPASLFEFVESTRVVNGLRLRWASVAGKTYRVRRSPTLLASPSSYSVLQSGIGSTPPVNELTDTEAVGSAMYFYLVEVQQ